MSDIQICQTDVTLQKLLELSKAQFPYLYDGNDYSIYFLTLLGGSTMAKYVTYRS